MFKLDQSIAEWRRQMRTAGVAASKVLDELESHVRDDVAEQLRAGADAEQAFAAAVQRIGRAGVLRTEFAKGRTRTIWRRLMVGCGCGLMGLILFLSEFTFYEMEMSARAQILAFGAIGLTLVAGWGWRYAVPHLPVIRNRRARLAMGLVAVLSGLAFTVFLVNVILPRWEAVDERVGMIALLWFLLPSMVLGCLGLGLMLSEEERRSYGMGHD